MWPNNQVGIAVSGPTIARPSAGQARYEARPSAMNDPPVRRAVDLLRGTVTVAVTEALSEHVLDEGPHPAYDDAPDFAAFYRARTL